MFKSNETAPNNKKRKLIKMSEKHHKFHDKANELNRSVVTSNSNNLSSISAHNTCQDNITINSNYCIIIPKKLLMKEKKDNEKSLSKSPLKNKKSEGFNISADIVDYLEELKLNNLN